MKFSLRRRTYLLVVFALTATIGLTSCADTFTGYQELEPDTSIQDAASLKDNYGQEHASSSTHNRGRVAPTPADEVIWPSQAVGQSASLQHLGDDVSAPLLLSGDSLTVPPPPTPNNHRIADRF